MESTRQLKISRLLQKELSEVFLFEARNLFGHAMITVTKVHVAKDLSIAKVYLSLFGVMEKKELFKSIDNHTKEIRRALGMRVKQQLRVVPELHFFMDDSLDYIENIDKLLKE